MKKGDIIGLVLGGACLTSAFVLMALNGGKPVLGKKNVEYFVIDVGKSVSGIKDNGRTLGEIAEVWSEGRK
ncbi:MAG: hypothetical protein IKZ19_06785 [Clostridia bacterium]|nr:hypothetical protein [Clostridia bacterium]